jgi:hypothetical protein
MASSCQWSLVGVPVSEFLRVEKAAGSISDELISTGFASFVASLSSFFGLRSMHVSICDNVLYDTSLGEGVKERLACLERSVKKGYPQSRQPSSFQHPRTAPRRAKLVGGVSNRRRSFARPRPAVQ